MDKIDISVLLPTRGRTTSLHDCIMTLLDRAKNPRAIEILIAFDDDDIDSYQYFQKNIEPKIGSSGASYTCLGFERLGYIRLNEYINALAKQSQGRWLMFWSDDALMDSDHWDQKICDINDFRVLRMPTHNFHPYAIFPIVPRAWYEMFGYVSAHQLTDSWVSQIAYMVDIMQNIEIKVIHDRADLTGNNNDETYKNRPYLEGNPNDPRDFNNATWRDKRSKDAKTIAEYLKQHGQKTDWFDRVSEGTQDPWEKMMSPEYDPNKQMTRISQ